MPRGLGNVVTCVVGVIGWMVGRVRLVVCGEIWVVRVVVRVIRVVRVVDMAVVGMR